MAEDVIPVDPEQELEAEVERKVFGRRVYQYRQTPYLHMSDHDDGHGAVYKIPRYSVDIAAAMTILGPDGPFGCRHIELVHWGDSDLWQVNLGGHDRFPPRDPYTMPQEDWQETLPLAICVAVLAVRP